MLSTTGIGLSQDKQIQVIHVSNILPIGRNRHREH